MLLIWSIVVQTWRYEKGLPRFGQSPYPSENQSVLEYKNRQGRCLPSLAGTSQNVRLGPRKAGVKPTRRKRRSLSLWRPFTIMYLIVPFLLTADLMDSCSGRLLKNITTTVSLLFRLTWGKSSVPHFYISADIHLSICVATQKCFIIYTMNVLSLQIPAKWIAFFSSREKRTTITYQYLDAAVWYLSTKTQCDTISRWKNWTIRLRKIEHDVKGIFRFPAGSGSIVWCSQSSGVEYSLHTRETFWK